MEKDKRATVLVFPKLKREQKRELKGRRCREFGNGVLE